MKVKNEKRFVVVAIAFWLLVGLLAGSWGGGGGGWLVVGWLVGWLAGWLVGWLEPLRTRDFLLLPTSSDTESDV